MQQLIIYVNEMCSVSLIIFHSRSFFFCSHSFTFFVLFTFFFFLYFNWILMVAWNFYCYSKPQRINFEKKRWTIWNKSMCSRSHNKTPSFITTFFLCVISPDTPKHEQLKPISIDLATDFSLKNIGTKCTN